MNIRSDLVPGLGRSKTNEKEIFPTSNFAFFLLIFEYMFISATFVDSTSQGERNSELLQEFISRSFISDGMGACFHLPMSFLYIFRLYTS